MGDQHGRRAAHGGGYGRAARPGDALFRSQRVDLERGSAAHAGRDVEHPVYGDRGLGYSGSLVNQVDVSTAEGATDRDVETSQSRVTPQFEVLKRADPALVEAGETLTYRIWVTNTGNVDLNATVTDTLPAQVTHPSGLREVVWTPTIPAPGGVWTEQFTVTANWGYSGTLSNEVEVTTGDGARETIAETSRAEVHASLIAAKAADPLVVQAGETLTYTVWVTNTGNVTLTATVTDVLPTQVSHFTGLNEVVWTPTIGGPGGVWTEQFTVTVDWGYSGTLRNGLWVDTEQGAAGAFAEVSRAVAFPSLEVTKQADPPVTEAGETLTYTLWATNTGGVPLSATITDVLPTHVVHPSGLDKLVWTPAIGGPDGVWTEQFTVTVDWGYSGTLHNELQATSTQGADDAFVLDTPVRTTPSLALAKQVESPLVGPGEALTWTVWVTNTGNVTLTLSVTDTLPAGLTPTGDVMWAPELGSPGAVWSATLPTVADADAAGPLTNVVTATSVQGASGAAQAVATVCWPLEGMSLSGPVTGTTGVGVTLTATVVPPAAGQWITFTWEASEQPTTVRVTDNPIDVHELTWAVSGTKVVTVTAQSMCGVVVQAVAQVLVEEPLTCPAPLLEINTTGPSETWVGQGVSLTAQIDPPDATVPVNLDWSPAPVQGQGTAAAFYRWDAPGTYTVTVSARNCGGTVWAEHVVRVREVQPVHLPMVLHNYVYAPDLEVVDVQIVLLDAEDEADYVLVTIRNNGPAPVREPFWVDLYLDPTSVPQAGQIWGDLCDVGKAWLVREPLSPGQEWTLNSRAADDPANPDDRYSIWPEKLPAGEHVLYAQVDSYWAPVGLVVERDETNNLWGPVPYQRTVLLLHPVPVPRPTPTPVRPDQVLPRPMPAQ